MTGATGLVGYRIARHLARRGHAVLALGRRPVDLPGVAHRRFELAGALPDLGEVDALVHAALSHLPGRYRGGEGEDSAGFRRDNLDGTLRLFAHARACGVGRIVFLSSRAVYDGYPPGTALEDGLPARPAGLYGSVKAEGEAALADMVGDGAAVASLRATGIYGASAPGHPHKWADLFAAFDAGEAVAPRVGTELHGDDLASAVDLLLRAEAAALRPLTFNASDIVLDRRDLLATYAELAGGAGRLPPRGDPARVSVMRCDRLRQLGWTPRGMAGFRQSLRDMLAREAGSAVPEGGETRQSAKEP
ncbi:NAD-dependent epimerase/dehydratase family protein [Jannaschia seosinensis]|uniref:NAD-dependent epimerase/dehydratase family protein n=1 Tax=Jannaschia seosinensis TaxID=313367 RepID=UPI001FDFC35A|nr:NAD(P)-dependent oxidoreductase [Jannaschia seosinensis]